MCILLEKADFLTGWGYQNMKLESVILEKAFSDDIRSGVLVPDQKSRFLIQSMSRFTGLQFTGLPCLPVFFFSCHPVTPIYRWYAGIPGWFIFSCSRSPSCCCTLPHTLLHTTQHNTLGVAGSSNTCLHTMPCAAGELCQLSDSTTTPEFSCCGPCGGRLHRICGDPDGVVMQWIW